MSERDQAIARLRQWVGPEWTGGSGPSKEMVLHVLQALDAAVAERQALTEALQTVEGRVRQMVGFVETLRASLRVFEDDRDALTEGLRDSLRSGLLFGSVDEPLDEGGKRVVRVILQRLGRKPSDA